MFQDEVGELGTLAEEKLGLVLTKQQLDQFALYGRLLLAWNKKVNLTRITEPSEIIIKHFLDSLVALPYLSGLSVCDVGTGAGFPGIPLAIAKPDLNGVLVDSLGKRVEFLKYAVTELGLRVEAVHARAEEFGRVDRFRGSFDAVVSRAVAALPVLSEYALPLLKRGGTFFAYKGLRAPEEVQASQRALEILGGACEQVVEINLGALAEHRSLIMIRKVKETPPGYPRKAGQPERKPLVQILQ